MESHETFIKGSSSRSGKRPPSIFLGALLSAAASQVTLPSRAPRGSRGLEAFAQPREAAPTQSREKKKGPTQRKGVKDKVWREDKGTAHESLNDKWGCLRRLKDAKTSDRDKALAVAALQQREWMDSIEEYGLAMKVLGDLKYWKESYGLLADMRRHGLTPDVLAYNTAMQAMSISGEWSEVLNVIGEMYDEGIRPDVKSYTIAIVACSRAGKWVEALQLLAEMERKGVKADTTVFSAAILACAKAGELTRAKQLFDSMPRRGLQPDEFTFAAVMNVCAKERQWEEALDFLSIVGEQGLNNAATYSSALYAMDMSGRGLDALQILLDMMKAKVAPSAPCYTHAIRACLKARMKREAMEILEELLESDCTMDVIAYSNAIRAADNPDTIQRLMTDMVNRLVIPDQKLYGAAIVAYNRCGDPEASLRTLEMMKKDGMTPDIININSAIRACEEASNWEMALSLLVKAPSADRITYTCAINACGASGEWEKALHLLYSCRKRFDMDGAAYSAGFKACRTSQRWREAVALVKKMEFDDLWDQVNVRYAANMCAECEQHEAAKQLFSKIDDRNWEQYRKKLKKRNRDPIPRLEDDDELNSWFTEWDEEDRQRGKTNEGQFRR